MSTASEAHANVRCLFDHIYMFYEILLIEYRLMTLLRPHNYVRFVDKMPPKNRNLIELKKKCSP